MDDEKVREMLDEGILLGAAKLAFLAESTQQNYNNLISIMRDSSVIVPMRITPSQEDIKQFLNSKAGDTVTTKSDIRMKPDIFKDKEGKLFFPCFSTKREIPEEYPFSQIKMSMISCIETALKQKGICGIVLDGFTSPFTITPETAEFIKRLPPYTG